jgi:hypothetical protein
MLYSSSRYSFKAVEDHARERALLQPVFHVSRVLGDEKSIYYCCRGRLLLLSHNARLFVSYGVFSAPETFLCSPLVRRTRLLTPTF